MSSDSSDDIVELLSFLTPSTRSDVRDLALDYLLKLASSTDTSSVEARTTLFEGTSDAPSTAIRRIIELYAECPPSRDLCAKVLTQLIDSFSGHRLDGAYTCANLPLQRWPTAKSFRTLYRKRPRFATPADVSLATNLSVDKEGAECSYKAIGDEEESRHVALYEMCEIMSRTPRAMNAGVADGVGGIVRNLTQLNDVRRWLTLNDVPSAKRTATAQTPLHIVVSLAAQLPAAEKDADLKERVNQSLHILRNLCMDGELHEALVASNNEALIVALLMPLCGGEELTEEENDKLPIDLQYLEETKKRTDDVHTRRTLLEALYQLCATRISRERLRDYGIYPLLRNYHKCETDNRCKLIAGNTISLLLRTEDEIGAENLQKDVPVTIDEHSAEMHSTLTEVSESKNNWVQ